MPLNFATHDMSGLSQSRALRLTLIAVCYSAFLAAAPRLGAQADPDSVKLRNDCRLATQVLTTGQPDPHRAEALSKIGMCGSSALLVIADVWGSALLDSNEVPLLATSTRPYPSDVLAQRLLQVAASASRPQLMRLYAMAVLVTFVDPGSIISGEQLGGPTTYLFGGLDHPVPQVGRETLTIPLRSQFVALAKQLSTGDADPVIRRAAEHVLRNFGP